MAQPQREDEVVTAYTAGADAAPPAYPGQPRNVYVERLPSYVAPKASLAAKAGVVFALFGLFAPVGSLLAIACGIIALSRKDPSVHGRTMAYTAIGVGVAGLLLSALLLGLFEPR